MANYVIGDVQGCFDSLMALCKKLNYSPSRDRLWFCGDLVNRGPKSLDTLRWIMQQEDSARTVLGNHDLHLLALWCGTGRQHISDTITPVVQAPDGEVLVNWLRQQPLALKLPDSVVEHTPKAAPSIAQAGSPRLLVHAGILPQWSMEQALSLSSEYQSVMSAPNWQAFMSVMYGGKPNLWDDGLQGHDRLRLIVNVFTRMRMLKNSLKLEFKHKLAPQLAEEGLEAWFEKPRQDSKPVQVFFGHWSTLGLMVKPNAVCLDTGCVWGEKLTAFCLETDEIIQVDTAETGLPAVGD